MSSAAFPEPPATVPPTPMQDVDRKVAKVHAKKDEWPKVRIPQRIAHLRKCLDGVLAVAERWVKDGSRLKGIPEGDVLVGEEWIAGPMVTARNIRLLIEALEAGGQPSPPEIREREGG